MIETSNFIKGIKNRNIANYPPRGFYPVILSKYLIDRQYYNLDYCTATGCDKTFDEKEKIVKGFNNLFEVWWSYFPENNYQFWGDEHWGEVKPNGKTVNYISLFLEKLIKACEIDIDEIEGLNV